MNRSLHTHPLLRDGLTWTKVCSIPGDSLTGITTPSFNYELEMIPKAFHGLGFTRSRGCWGQSLWMNMFVFSNTVLYKGLPRRRQDLLSLRQGRCKSESIFTYIRIDHGQASGWCIFHAAYDFEATPICRLNESDTHRSLWNSIEKPFLVLSPSRIGEIRTYLNDITTKGILLQKRLVSWRQLQILRYI